MLILPWCQCNVLQTGTEFQSPHRPLCPRDLSLLQPIASALLLGREIEGPPTLLNE